MSLQAAFYLVLLFIFSGPVTVASPKHPGMLAVDFENGGSIVFTEDLSRYRRNAVFFFPNGDQKIISSELPQIQGFEITLEGKNALEGYGYSKGPSYMYGPPPSPNHLPPLNDLYESNFYTHDTPTMTFITTIQGEIWVVSQEGNFFKIGKVHSDADFLFSKVVIDPKTNVKYRAIAILDLDQDRLWKSISRSKPYEIFVVGSDHKVSSTKVKLENANNRYPSHFHQTTFDLSLVDHQLIPDLSIQGLSYYRSELLHSSPKLKANITSFEISEMTSTCDGILDLKKL